MRRHGAMVPVFSLQGHCLRHVSLAEAIRMIELKQADRISAANAATLKIQLRMLDRESKNSPATITKGEMLAASATAFRGSQSRTAGMSEARKLERAMRGLPAEDFIERAVEKIKCWADVGDTKAIRVGPLGVSRPVLAT